MPARSAQGTLRRFLRFENSHIGVVYTYKEHPRNSRSWALPGRVCHRHGGAHACTGARGNLYRFVEPAVLLLLKKEGGSCAVPISETQLNASVKLPRIVRRERLTGAREIRVHSADVHAVERVECLCDEMSGQASGPMPSFQFRRNRQVTREGCSSRLPPDWVGATQMPVWIARPANGFRTRPALDRAILARAHPHLGKWCREHLDVL